MLDPAARITERGALAEAALTGASSWAKPELGYVGCYFIQQLPPRPESTEWISAVTQALS